MAVGVGGAIARGVVVVLNAPTQMSLPTAAPVVATPPALVMLGGAAALVALSFMLMPHQSVLMCTLSEFRFRHEILTALP